MYIPSRPTIYSLGQFFGYQIASPASRPQTCPVSQRGAAVSKEAEHSPRSSHHLQSRCLALESVAQCIKWRRTERTAPSATYACSCSYHCPNANGCPDTSGHIYLRLDHSTFTNLTCVGRVSG